MVGGLVRDMGERGVALAFAQVRGPVRDRLRRTGLMEAVGEDRCITVAWARPLERALERAARAEPDVRGGRRGAAGLTTGRHERAAAVRA